MTGHLLGASGALEAAITSLAVAEETIPPTINLHNADPECDLELHAKQGAARSHIRCPQQLIWFRRSQCFSSLPAL